jgi:hypothetical protein
MISRLFDTAVTSKRMAWTDDSGSEVAATSFNARFQQASAEQVQLVAEALGKVYAVWCAATVDVDKGDTLTVATGNFAGTYSVKAVQAYYDGANQHIELIAVADV